MKSTFAGMVQCGMATKQRVAPTIWNIISNTSESFSSMIDKYCNKGGTELIEMFFNISQIISRE